MRKLIFLMHMCLILAMIILVRCVIRTVRRQLGFLVAGI